MIFASSRAGDFLRRLGFFSPGAGGRSAGGRSMPKCSATGGTVGDAIGWIGDGAASGGTFARGGDSLSSGTYSLNVGGGASGGRRCWSSSAKSADSNEGG